jgi:hypothetical protein
LFVQFCSFVTIDRERPVQYCVHLSPFIFNFNQIAKIERVSVDRNTTTTGKMRFYTLFVHVILILAPLIGADLQWFQCNVISQSKNLVVRRDIENGNWITDITDSTPLKDTELHISPGEVKSATAVSIDPDKNMVAWLFVFEKGPKEALLHHSKLLIKSMQEEFNEVLIEGGNEANVQIGPYARYRPIGFFNATII